MRVLHCCLAAFYNEGYGYQENILPRMHKKQGHDVKIIASTETFVDNMNLGYVSPVRFNNEDDIPVVRIPYISILPFKVASKLRIYVGLEAELLTFAPDVIFLHDAQFLSITTIIKYLKANRKVRVYVDGHTDFGNSATTFLSKYILHGVIYKWCIKRIEPFVTKFYGTLPARVEFFTDFYKTPKSKTELLVLGADDDCVKRAKDDGSRFRIRVDNCVSDKTLLIVTGGKFDERKISILYLMKAVHRLRSSYDVKLLIFGSVMGGSFKEAFDELCDGDVVKYVGWINSNLTYNYFEAADLIVFTGSHSVLWEQAVGQGKPCVFNSYMHQKHIDLGGNCKFLHNVSEEDIVCVVTEAIKDYEMMKNAAESKGIPYFSYYSIAERAIAAK